MSQLIIFDFDNTLAHISSLHRAAWKLVLEEVGLTPRLSLYLPYEKYLTERFDSDERVKRHFLKSRVDREVMQFFFGTTDDDKIVSELMDLKESHLLQLIDGLSTADLASFFANNIFPGIDAFEPGTNKLGIVSNTRESIILAVLGRYGLNESFNFIIGEESLYDERGHLRTKHDGSVKAQIPASILKVDYEASWYVGDDPRIDSLVARNFGLRFVQTDKETDLLVLCQRMKELV